ncbi:polysaccharide biosynthesis/export family protein [Methylobacterium sp. 37f]|uniref:polysaccharide biosynthesis/export family protein n=1 Tax=Methylobacterium sp. 37f TaxID=2817058 RepID=UPI001FFD1E6E|nr:polysaccharide biosynthesis/export family protein [Methylobacterium sp. 37f]MCK2055583.1 polysaccharide biosynthesis/export family protein [Methylobacterium sp. 37f]
MTVFERWTVRLNGQQTYATAASKRPAHPVRSLALAVLAAVTGFTSPVSAAEYRLQPGDTLELSVAGIPELRQRLPVTIDGDISVPLAGDIKAQGKTVAEVRDLVREALPRQSLNMRTSGNGEQQTVVAPGEISLVIADYRPIYVTGDVSKPGEQRYTPGLSVRQAVSLAGGYDLQRFRMDSPILATADLRGEYENLWIDLAQGQATIARLRTELDGKQQLDETGLEKLPIPASTQEKILQNEQGLLKSRLDDYSKETAHLKNAQRITEERLTAIQDQYRKDTEAAKLDVDEIERIADLNKRGVVPLTRAVETRRLSLTTATRALQTGVETERAKRDLLEAQRSVARLSDQRRADLMRDIQDATVKLAQTRSKLSAVGEKLLYTGVVRSQMVRGTGGKPQVIIHRRGGSGVEILQADEDASLQPGDTVEIALKLEYEFKPSAK